VVNIGKHIPRPTRANEHPIASIHLGRCAVCRAGAEINGLASAATVDGALARASRVVAALVLVALVLTATPAAVVADGAALPVEQRLQVAFEVAQKQLREATRLAPPPRSTILPLVDHRDPGDPRLRRRRLREEGCQGYAASA